MDRIVGRACFAMLASAFNTVEAASPGLFAFVLSSKYAGASNLRRRDIIRSRA
jgi:hypothetical protein